MIGETKYQIISQVLEEIVGRMGSSQNKILLPGLIPSMNKKIVGILQSELWILGGYSSSGKTFLSLQVALEASLTNWKVLYVSLEMAQTALALRLWASLAQVQPLKLQFGLFSAEEIERIKKAKEIIKNLDFYFCDSLYGISAIEKVIRELKPNLVIIDYLQNLLPDGREQSEYYTLSNGIVKLQKLAKEMMIAIWCCSQVSNVEAKEGVSSKIIGYKGSGGLAAACDVGLWLERKTKYKETPKFGLYCRKNRRGNLFKVNLELRFPNGIFCETD